MSKSLIIDNYLTGIRIKRQAFNVLFAGRILANLGLSQRFAELQNHPSRPLDLGVKAA